MVLPYFAQPPSHVGSAVLRCMKGAAAKIQSKNIWRRHSENKRNGKDSKEVRYEMSGKHELGVANSLLNFEVVVLMSIDEH